MDKLIRGLVDHLLRSMDEEDRLVQEIILDDEDVENVDYEDLIQGLAVGRDLGGYLEDLLGPAMIGDMLQVLNDAELAVEIMYGVNDRHIDWQANLPRIVYMRGLEDPYFLQHFRMDRQTFERLIVVMGHHLTFTGRLIRLRTEIDKSLLMAVWILANLDTFRATGVAFGVSRGTVHAHYLIVIEALRELAPRYIKWPPPLERQRIAETIERRTGYRGIVGAIDGTLITTTAPSIQRERYFDRHQRYSLNVQAVCDHNLLYRDVYLGQPGSVHDSRVFQRSPLYDLFLEGDALSEGEHIIGDGGYEITDKLLTPFTNRGNLTQRERHFYFIHAGIRMFVERSFGSLKGKMRRLLKLYIKRFVYCLDHILSSFVLHNFIILRGEDADGICIIQDQAPDPNRDYAEFQIPDDEPEEEQEIVQQPGVGGVNRAQAGMEHPLLQQAKAAGREKREVIADELYRHVLHQ